MHSIPVKAFQKCRFCNIFRKNIHGKKRSIVSRDAWSTHTEIQIKQLSIRQHCKFEGYEVCQTLSSSHKTPECTCWNDWNWPLKICRITVIIKATLILLTLENSSVPCWVLLVLVAVFIEHSKFVSYKVTFGCYLYTEHFFCIPLCCFSIVYYVNMYKVDIMCDRHSQCTKNAVFKLK